MKWNIPGVGAKAPASTKVTTTKKWAIPTITAPKAVAPIAPDYAERMKAGVAARTVVKPTGIPKLYNPNILPTFNKETGKFVRDVGEYEKELTMGLDYFNRYAETALSTLGALTDTYTGYAWNKDTWSIAKQRIAESYSQIWSPPALTAVGVPSAVGQAVGNILSLAGEAIVAWQMGKAVIQTGKQLQMTNRRIWGMEKVDEVLTAVDDLKTRVSAAGEGATVMPESKSYGALISSVAKASENPSQKTMGTMMSDYAAAIRESQVVGATIHPELGATIPPSAVNALATLADKLANPIAQANLAAFIKALPPNINPGIATVPLTVKGEGVPVGQPVITPKPVTALAEIPKPEVVTPTVHRYQIPATATPQISPPVAISPQETSVDRSTPPIAPQIAQESVRAEVAPTALSSEQVADAIISGKGLIPDEAFAQFVAEYPDGIVRDGKRIKVVIPNDAEGNPMEPRVVRVVLPDGSTDFPDAITGRAPISTPVAETATTPSTPTVSKMEIPQAVAPSTEKSAVVQPVKWGKWKKAGAVEYQLAKDSSEVRVWTGSSFLSDVGKQLQFKGDEHSYYLLRDGAVPARKGFPATPASYRIIEARSGNSLVARQDTESGVVSVARESLDKLNDTNDRITELVGIHGGVANTVSNTAPLPAGQTGLTGEVAPQVSNISEPFPVSGTSNQVIPADDESISRIAVAFNNLADAKKSGGIKKSNIDAFYQAMVDAKVPKNAIQWKGYHKIENVKSPEKQMAMVKDEVDKYNAKVLGKKITDIAHVREAKRAVKEAVKEAVALTEKQGKEQMEENGKKLLAAAKKAVEGQKFGDQIRHARSVEALKQRTKDMLGTQKWITAAINRRVKDAGEREALLSHFKSLKLTRLPADIAERIAEVTKGIKGAEKLFELPSDTEFAYVLEKQGIEVKERQANPVMTELDLPALRELWSHVKGLIKVGVDEKTAIRLEQRSLVETKADACIASLVKNMTPAQIPDRSGELQPVYRANRGKEAVATMDILLDQPRWLWEELDDWSRGALTEAFFDDAITMEDYRARTRNKLMDEYNAKLKDAGITEKTYNATRTLPNGTAITQAQAMFIAMNSMSEQNLFHLRNGHNLRDETIKQAIESLTKQEAAFVDYMARTERGAWARVNFAHELTHDGQSLPKIDNYVHIDIETNDPLSTHDFSKLTIEEMLARGFAKNEANNEFTKMRTPRSAKRLREDSIFSFTTYILDATDYIFRAPVIKTMNGVVNDGVFADAYTYRAGVNRYKALQKYVEHVADPSTALGLYGQEHVVDRFFRSTRGNTAIAYLAVRLSRFFTAGASYSVSLDQFGGKAMLLGTTQIVAHPRATAATVKQLMPLVYERLAHPVRIEAQIADLRRQWGNKEARIREIAGILFHLADTLDIKSAAIGGLAKYQALHPEWSTEKCAYEVQREIMATHPLGIVETKPGFYMQGELARNLGMFTEEATSVSNYLGHLGRGALRGKVPKARFLKAFFLAVVVLAQIMRLAEKISGRKEDEDKWWNTWWGATLMELINTTLPIFGNLITGSIEGRAFGLPIGFKFIETGTRAATYLFKGDIPATLKWAAITVGYLKGLPVGGYQEIERWLTPTPTTTQTGPTKLPSLSKRPSLPKPPRP